MDNREGMLETELYQITSMLVGAGVMHPADARKLLGFTVSRDTDESVVLEGEIIPPNPNGETVAWLNAMLARRYDELGIGMPDDIEHEDESASRIVPKGTHWADTQALDLAFQAATRGFVAIYDQDARPAPGEVTVMQDTRHYLASPSYGNVSIMNRPLGLIGALYESVGTMVIKSKAVEMDRTLRLPPEHPPPYMGPARNRKEKRAERARAKRRR